MPCLRNEDEIAAPRPPLAIVTLAKLHRKQLQRRELEAANEGFVYIGRDSSGLHDMGWGNPYKIGDGHPTEDRPMTRHDVVDLHRAWFWAEIRKDPKAARARLLTLEGKRLCCWCREEGEDAPRCHGDNLIEALHLALRSLQQPEPPPTRLRLVEEPPELDWTWEQICANHPLEIKANGWEGGLQMVQQMRYRFEKMQAARTFAAWKQQEQAYRNQPQPLVLAA